MSWPSFCSILPLKKVVQSVQFFSQPAQLVLFSFLPSARLVLNYCASFSSSSALLFCWNLLIFVHNQLLDLTKSWSGPSGPTWEPRPAPTWQSWPSGSPCEALKRNVYKIEVVGTVKGDILTESHIDQDHQCQHGTFCQPQLGHSDHLEARGRHFWEKFIK